MWHSASTASSFKPTSSGTKLQSRELLHNPNQHFCTFSQPHKSYPPTVFSNSRIALATSRRREDESDPGRMAVVNRCAFGRTQVAFCHDRTCPDTSLESDYRGLSTKPCIHIWSESGSGQLASDSRPCAPSAGRVGCRTGQLTVWTMQHAAQTPPICTRLAPRSPRRSPSRPLPPPGFNRRPPRPIPVGSS